MKALILIPALLLAGCASTEYAQYTKANSDIAVAKSNSDAARYNALAQIAKDGDAASRVAAVMALAMGGGQGATVQVQAPQRSEALQWASILVPGLTQAWAISKNADVAMNSSNNAASTSIATTQGFVNMGGKIQAPGVPQANVSTVTNTDNSQAMSGTGVLGSGTYSTEANPINTPVFAPVVVPDVVQVVPIVNQPVVVPDTITQAPVIITPVVTAP